MSQKIKDIMHEYIESENRFRDISNLFYSFGKLIRTEQQFPDVSAGSIADIEEEWIWALDRAMTKRASCHLYNQAYENAARYYQLELEEDEDYNI